MKKIFIIGVAVLTLAGCSKALDNIRPKHAISAESLTEDDLGKLTNGVLYQMENYAVSGWNDGDYLGENFTAGPGFEYADYHSETEAPSSGWAKSRWQAAFTRINFQNEVIAIAKAATQNDASNEAIGTALFCRAWTYFQLYIRFGSAPVLTAPTMDVVAFTTDQAGRDRLWGQIEADLLEAEKYLKTFSSFAYPSKEACWTLLSKVYLWKGDNAKAITYADKVIENPAFKFKNTSVDFASMFVNGTTNSELIFALANLRNSDQLRLFERMNDTDGSFNYSMATELRTTLFDDSEAGGVSKAGDIRLAPTYNASQDRRIIKFPNGGANMGQFIENKEASQSPIVIFRLADVYLTKAEAQGNTSEGIATMGTFMENRYSTVSMPVSMSEADFRDLVLDEDQREFYAEGRRWFDIKRVALRDSSLDLDEVYESWGGRDHLLFWPIPQDERDLAGHDNYPQNVGYAQ